MKLELVSPHEAGAVEDVIGFQRHSEEASVGLNGVVRSCSAESPHLPVGQRHVEVRELDEIALSRFQTSVQ